MAMLGIRYKGVVFGLDAIIYLKNIQLLGILCRALIERPVKPAVQFAVCISSTNPKQTRAADCCLAGKHCQCTLRRCANRQNTGPARADGTSSLLHA